METAGHSRHREGPLTVSSPHGRPKRKKAGAAARERLSTPAFIMIIFGVEIDRIHLLEIALCKRHQRVTSR